MAEAAGRDDGSSAGDLGLRGRFWRLVVIFNLALLGLGVGALLIAFEGRVVDGGALMGIGALAFLYGYRTYRRTRAALE